MTFKEIEERGLKFSGYYNHYPAYYYVDVNYYDCDTQYSYMTIAGNCLNNNSEIYCVILGQAPERNQTSTTAKLTVIGMCM